MITPARKRLTTRASLQKILDLNERFEEQVEAGSLPEMHEGSHTKSFYQGAMCVVTQINREIQAVLDELEEER